VLVERQSVYLISFLPCQSIIVAARSKRAVASEVCLQTRSCPRQDATAGTVLSVTWVARWKITQEHGKHRGSLILLLLWFSVVEICILKGEKPEEERR